MSTVIKDIWLDTRSRKRPSHKKLVEPWRNRLKSKEQTIQTLKTGKMVFELDPETE